MRSLVVQLLCLVLLGPCSSARSALPEAPKKKKKAAMYDISIYRNTIPPILDGDLSPQEWRNATIISNFTQKEPEEGLPVSEPTVVLITYDQGNVYFGIRCFDSAPKNIVANEMRRDKDLSDNDYVEIIIDTFHDQRNAYYFATNSLGARLDSEIKSEGEFINWDWDGVWFSTAKRDLKGWTAEVAIPFETLRFEGEEELVWGINFGRYIPRKREESYWSPISRDDDFDNYGKFRVSKFGVMRGLRNVKHDKRFRVKPYVVAGVEKAFDGISNERRTDIGLDTKILITSNVISDLTINPDFAQVEADQEQVNLTRFNLFFPEKREFFIEGLDMFNIGEEFFGEPLTLLFFSRSIGLVPVTLGDTLDTLVETDIMGGVKLTGKAGPYEFGGLDVYTKKLAVDNWQFAANTNFAAGRVKRDVFKRSYVGVMGLSKDEAGGDYNRTFAVDGLFSFDNNLTLGGYYARTWTPGLQGKDTNAHLRAGWGNDLLYTNASFSDIGENFNPEMGFLQWQDVRRYTFALGVSPRPRFLNLKQTDLSYDLEYITDHNNELQYRTISAGLFNQFKDHSFLYFGLLNFYDNLPQGLFLEQTFIDPGIYKYSLFGISYASDLSRKVGAVADLTAGTFYDGTLWSAAIEGYLRPNDKLGIDLSLDWNRVDVPFEAGQFTTTIMATRFIYSFTPNLYGKAFIQWNHFEKRIVSNILFNFIHSPGSDLFLVYNEEWDTRDQLSSRNRTFVAKVTYMLDF